MVSHGKKFRNRKIKVVAKQQKRLKHIPQRTCVGCREVLSKRELLRIVRTSEGVMHDPTGKMDGRGAYLHDKKSCWEQALKGSLAHALKTELTQKDRSQLEEIMKNIDE
jgi:predicted RNA-binding protein YlxR (DUF448 family)